MLKKHQFFKGVEFEHLHKIKPPIDETLMEKIVAEKKLQKSDAGTVSPDDEIVEADMKAAAKKVEEEKKVPSPKRPGDHVIKEGIVSKKCGWIFYKKRKLILTSRPRLSYHSADSNEYKVRAITSTIIGRCIIDAKSQSGKDWRC